MASQLLSGYVMRAAKIAVKFGVRFDPTLGHDGGEFLGDVQQCAKAIMALDDWVQDETRRREQRREYR